VEAKLEKMTKEQQRAYTKGRLIYNKAFFNKILTQVKEDRKKK